MLPFGKSLWQLESVIQDLVVAESMTQGVVVAEHDDDSNGELVEVKQIDTSSMWAFVYLNMKVWCALRGNENELTEDEANS